MLTRTRIFASMLFAFAIIIFLAVPPVAWAQVTVIAVPSGGDLQAAIN
jgi:hypothetical protein